MKMADLPKIVMRRLQVSAEDGVHPDPDLLTAFAEQSLEQREQAGIFRHLAHCRECREVVALALPEQIDSSAISTAVSHSGWLSWPVLRWGAVAACVVVVGAAVTLHYASFQGSHPAVTAPTSDVAVVQDKTIPAPANEPANPAAPQPVGQSPSRDGVAAAPRNLDRSNVAEKAAPSANRLQADSSQKQKVSGTPAAAPLLAKSEPPAVTIPGRAKDESDLSAAKTNMSLGSGTASRQMMASSAMIARATAIPANATPRWTLTPEGMLQRSIDSGKTWETILVATPDTFRALTANGFDIWVGGAKGALYHSIDAGQHWMQVQPVSEGEALQADIIGIEFPDLMHGTLTTADNQTWITSDAGQTWTKQ